MTPGIVSLSVVLYFLVLLIIGYFTSKNADKDTFFTANRNSPWYLVAFGMIGASLSGVTFISVPGEVGNTNFHYFQVVLGYTVGYFVIGKVLLPLYYRLNLVSIYGYLGQRFGKEAYKTGAAFFLLSRVVGSSFRLFLVASVLQIAIFDVYDIPFWVTVATTILLIWIYTYRGGIKTIVWTDTLQTFFMLSAAIVTVIILFSKLDFSFTEGVKHLIESKNTKIFHWEWRDSTNFFKQFISGAFIAIVMTGLDQDMMQKNLTCRSLKDAQKNMLWFTIVLVFVNLIFLGLGALMYSYSADIGITIPARTDYLYPELALNYLPLAGGLLFVLGIIAAAYSSADSALTSLTTSFSYDILNFERIPVEKQPKVRRMVHVGFSILLFFVILIFHSLNDQSVITSIFLAAGYTYGPILGLFVAGLFTKWELYSKGVPGVAILSPILTWIINHNSEEWLYGYKFGFEILLLNGLITLTGLFFLHILDKIKLLH